MLHLPVVAVGDGGLYSTVADLHLFWEALNSGRIVSRRRVSVSLAETWVRVSCMETADSGAKPTPNEARDLLAAANTEEQFTVNRPVPAWYYPVLAVAIFALFSLNAIDEPVVTVRVVTVVLILALAVGIAALVGKISANQPGYKGIHVPWGRTILWMLLAAAFPVAAIALDDVVGSWVWIGCGAALGALLLAVGIPYHRKYRRG